MYPTIRFRLTVRIAQIPKTVPTAMAKPTPFHSMNPTAHVMISRFAHSSKLPLPVVRSSTGLRACLTSALIPVKSMDIPLLPGQKALWPEQQDQDQDEVGDYVLPLSGQVPDTELLDHPQGESATMAP